MRKFLVLIGLFLVISLLSGCTFFKNISSKNNPTAQSSASPIPTTEDTIKNLTNLINNGKVDEAVNLLGPDLNPDSNSKQAWTDNFSNIKSINLKTIEPWEKNSWTKDKEVYKTVLEVQLKVGSAAYGWANGDNTKWIEIDKASQPWKIDNIATGP